LLFGLSVPLVALVLASMGFFPEQKRRNGKYVVASLACVLLAVLVNQVGCAGSSANPSGGSSGTPAGTYTITVTGTYTGTYPSGTLVHSVPTTLAVQ